MTIKKTYKLRDLLKAGESPIRLSDSAAEAVRQIEMKSSASLIASEIKMQEDAPARIAAQMQDGLKASEQFQKQFGVVQKMIVESQTGLVSRAE